MDDIFVTKDYIYDQYNKGKNLILFGASEIARKTRRTFSQINFSCIIDNSQNLWGQQEEGLKILASIKKELDISIITDVHEKEQCQEVASVVDILQIPAFLCRQTDLLNKAAQTGKAVMVKKGQFLAPWEMSNIVNKLNNAGCNKIILCERGTSFGYNNLVSDMRSIPIMQKTGWPVIFDATHSVQEPGGLGASSGGKRQYVPYLAKASVAVGVSGIFIETHQDPDNAPSDGPNMLNITDLKKLLQKLKQIDNIIK